MQILILSHNYAPESTGIGPYTTELAEHFATGGHAVTALTTFPHYPKYRWQGKHRVFEQELRAGVRVRRLGVILPQRQTAMWRIAFDTSVGFASLLNSFGIARPDLIIGVIPTLQNGFAAGILAKRWRTPVILLIKDLPLEAGLAVGMLKQGLLYGAGSRFERLVYRMADRIVVIGDQFRDSLIAKGVAAPKVTILPDWVDLDRIRPMPADPSTRQLLSGLDNPFLVLHTGTMGEKQGLTSVIDAARHLTEDWAIRVVLVGDGPRRLLLEELIESSNLQNIQVLGLQPSETFPRILAAADLLLLNQRAGVIDAVVPSKLITYMAAGRPVVAAVNPLSAAARLIEKAACGVLVPPENPRRLADTIRALRRDPDLMAQLGRSGRLYAETMFGKVAVLRRWDIFVTEVVPEQAIKARV